MEIDSKIIFLIEYLNLNFVFLRLTYFDFLILLKYKHLKVLLKLYFLDYYHNTL